MLEVHILISKKTYKSKSKGCVLSNSG